MTNILTRNLDINDFFINGDLVKIAEVSDAVSENSKLTKIVTERLPNNDYAVVLKSYNGREFPKYAMNTAGITELNMAFLVSEMNTLPEELVKKAAHNLTASAGFFNIAIPEPLQPYKSDLMVDRLLNISDLNHSKFIEKIAGRCENLEQPTIFALKGKYPIDTVSNLEKSAEWFSRNYTKLDIDEQLEFSSSFLKQAEKLNINGLEKLGSYSEIDLESFNKDFRSHLNIRKTYIEDGTDRSEIFDDLWAQRLEIGPLKTAYVLEVIDKEYNLDDLYGYKIKTPVESVLGTLKKEASVEFENKDITLKKLRSLNIEKLDEVVGPRVTPELLGDSGLILFESLPYPMKQQIGKLINE